MKTFRPVGVLGLYVLAAALLLLLAACGGDAPSTEPVATETPAETESLPFTVVVESTARVAYATPTPPPVFTLEEQEAERKARNRERTWGEGAWEGTGDFLSVDVGGGGYACGLRTDGAIECWGDGYRFGDDDFDFTPPEGEFVSLSVGIDHACAIRTNDHLVCWGDNRNFQLNIADDIETPTFHSVSAGDDATCGLLKRPDWSGLDRAIFCSGDGYWGEEHMWEGEAVDSVSVGDDHVCAVRTDRTLLCWIGSSSSDDRGRDAPYVIPPEGAFDSISLGDSYTCGVRPGGGVECWGYDSQDRIGPTPDGEFKSVSVGDDYVCGIRPDGSIECWGSYPVPPFGEFASVSVSYDWGLNCGVRPTGAVICWDHNGHVERQSIGVP